MKNHSLNLNPHEQGKVRDIQAKPFFLVMAVDEQRVYYDLPELVIKEEAISVLNCLSHIMQPENNAEVRERASHFMAELVFSRVDLKAISTLTRPMLPVSVYFYKGDLPWLHVPLPHHSFTMNEISGLMTLLDDIAWAFDAEVAIPVAPDGHTSYCHQIILKLKELRCHDDGYIS